MDPRARTTERSRPFPEPFWPVRGFGRPTILYLAALLLAELGEFEFLFHTQLWQLVSPDLLTHDLARSVYYLHAQPPLLNLLAGLLLKSAAALSVDPAVVAKPLFLVLGWLTTCGLHRLLLAVTASNAWALGGTLLLLTDPAFWYFQNFFFYTLPLTAIFTAGAACLRSFLRSGSNRAFLGLAATLWLSVWLRALYHPAWAVLTTGAVLLARRRVDRTAGSWLSRGTRATLVGLISLLALWPAKNLALFGQWTYTTWGCYNFVTAPSWETRVIGAFTRRGVVPDTVRTEIAQFKQREGASAIPAIEEATKSDSTTNWNHYIFVLANRGATRRAIDYALHSPLEFVAQAAGNYFLWSGPAYRDSYSDRIEGPASPSYQTYATLHRRLFFPYLLPSDHPKGGASGDAIRTPIQRLTPFSGIVLPALLLAAAWRLAELERRRRRSDSAFLTILLFWIAWNLVVPAVSDAVESSRMRFPITPILIVVAALTLRPRRDEDHPQLTS
ncbi:MAG: hypothetical protein IPK72_22995 [Candidatus Eisenbacteria bacterium]|nr:hypothetical protein [Candidatus Eisenbacteria bacterium]